jgi:hypothetical protein
LKAGLAQHGRIALWLAWALPFGVYAASAYRTVGFWDIGEMDTVPWILGIAHPTGFPAYVLGGWFFTHVVPIGTVAYRMGLFSGLAMSLAAWLVARIVNDEYDAPWTGTVCAWLFAFGDIVWTRATRAEVHSLSTLAIAATLYLALRWYTTGDTRAFLAGALTWAVGLATHPVAVLIAPGLLVLLLARVRTLRLQTLAAAVAICAISVAGFYAYLPLRSAYVTAHSLDPTRKLSLAPGRPFWDYDHPATRAGFVAEVTGSDFDVEGGVKSIVSSAIYVNESPRYFMLFVKEFTPFGAALVIFGIGAAFARNRIRAAALLLASFASIPFALGFTEEGDPNRYFLTSYVAAAIFAGDGAMWFVAQQRRWRWIAPMMIAIFAGLLFYNDRTVLGQPNDNRASAMVDRVLELTPPDAIVVSSWSNATPLAYAAYVERRTDGRTIDAAWVGDDAQAIPGWMKTRPVYQIGPTYGEVRGYHFEMISTQPEMYRLVANRLPASQGVKR